MTHQDIFKSTTRLIESPFLVRLAIISVGIFYAITLREGHDWGGDFSQYILHARNIAEGRNYLDIGYIVTSLSFIAPAEYPPVFPLLLAPIYYFFGLDLNALKLVVVASFCLSLLFIHKIFRVNLPRSAVLLLLLVVGFNPAFWALRDQILSDFTFMMFSFMSLYLMQRSYDFYSTSSSTTKNIEILWTSALLGMVMYLAYGVREIGLVLPLTMLTYELIGLRKLTKISLIAIPVFTAFSMLDYYGIEGGYSNPVVQNDIAQLASEYGHRAVTLNHWDFFSLDINHLIEQVNYYAAQVAAFWLPDGSRSGLEFWSLLGWMLFGLVNLLALVGYASAVLKKITVLEIFPAGCMAVLILFGGRNGIRYILPVLPFLIYYAFLAIASLRRLGMKRIWNASVGLFCVAILLLYAHHITDKIDQTIESGVSRPHATSLWNYIIDETSSDETFIFVKPRVLTLMTGRRTYAYPSSKDPEFLVRYMDTIKADYLIVGAIPWIKAVKNPSTERFFNSQTRSFYSLTYKNEYFAVYRFDNQS